MPKPIDWRPAIVRATRKLTPDITWIEIAPERDYVAPAPGAHLKVAVTIGGRPDMRCYSIVAPCPGGAYAIAVKQLEATRGGSAYMATLATGARVNVAGPDNHFALTHGRPDYLLIAGGIGVTAIHSHAMALAHAGANVRVLYGVRGRADLALADPLAAALGDRLRLFVGDEGARIDLVAAFAEVAPGGEAYVCGPIPMLEAAKRAWRDSGRPQEMLRFETFGASGAWPTTAFRMMIPRLGKDIFVPAGKSMLDALKDAGVAMIYDCRKGECGLCALSILEVDGVVDHRDVFFSEDEKAKNAKLCTCVSRVYGRSITIDTADR